MTAYLQCTGRRASNMRSHAERGNEGNKYARKNQSWTIIIILMSITQNCRNKRFAIGQKSQNQTHVQNQCRGEP